MSTHKHVDKICCTVLAVTLILAFLFVNAEHLGLKVADTVMRYEKKLFDTSSVHNIDIVMDDWDSFIENCRSEEYYTCTVVIDNDAYKNVAIRGKGNTSLTQVEAYGNGRYSFKIEFDHYEEGKTYYGLDKLCLNNIIQDNTYMKDYLCYRMMDDMGVAAPLCSYAYITVNGEDWGLYLAVEGVEEGFLKRNYGSDYGELYKPDSMNMGGGRGNGAGFDMDEMLGELESMWPTDQTEGSDTENVNPTQQIPSNSDIVSNGMGEIPDDFGGQMPGGFGGEISDGFDGQMPDGFDGQMPDSFDGQMPDSFDGQMPDSFGGEIPDGFDGQMPDGFGGAMGSDDVLLKYIDDDAESYSNIFDNAKTDVTDADKSRLIEALERLSSGESIENTVDTDAVIRYFAVHNFVLNFDSYTGSMIHNYYLYEKDGILQMIPWDYNLAFGGFESSASADGLINYPIDSPVSSGSIEDRPMLSWIFASEEYTGRYHDCLSELVEKYFDSGYFEEMLDELTEMIASYVERDPTKFCTYEEFELGSETLKKFCLLRAESIGAQLSGDLGSSSDTQEEGTLVSADGIRVSDMGSMNNTIGGGNAEKPDNGADGAVPPQMNGVGGFDAAPNGESDAAAGEGNMMKPDNGADGAVSPQMNGVGGFDAAPNGESDAAAGKGNMMKPDNGADGAVPPQMNDNDGFGTALDGGSDTTSEEGESTAAESAEERSEPESDKDDFGKGNGVQREPQEGDAHRGGITADVNASEMRDTEQPLVLFAVSVGVLVLGIAFAAVFKRRG